MKKFNPNKMLFQTIVLLFSILVLQGCDPIIDKLSQLEAFYNNNPSKELSKKSNKKLNKKNRAKELPVVHISSVKNRNLSFASTLSGTLVANRKVKIFNQIEGMLIKLPFYEGQFVKKNQLIAALDKTLMQLDLNKSIVLEKQSILNLNRIKKLVPKNLVSEDEVSQARTLAAIAKTEVKKNRALLSYTTIKAPFSGFISERLNEPGDVLMEHSHILTVIDTQKLLVTFEISELLLPDISIGDTINIQIDALGKTFFSSKVIRKHPVIDPISHQGIVDALLALPPTGAIPGQLVRINFITKKKKYLTIPVTAIRHDQHSAFVFLLDENTHIVTKRQVELGITIDEYIEITKGLSLNEKIIIKGQYNLKSGRKVQILTPSKL